MESFPLALLFLFPDASLVRILDGVVDAAKEETPPEEEDLMEEFEDNNDDDEEEE